jgi:hypothetical protein
MCAYPSGRYFRGRSHLVRKFAAGCIVVALVYVAVQAYVLFSTWHALSRQTQRVPTDASDITAPGINRVHASGPSSFPIDPWAMPPVLKDTVARCDDNTFDTERWYQARYKAGHPPLFLSRQSYATRDVQVNTRKRNHNNNGQAYAGQLNSFTHLKALLVLHDRGVVA